VATTFYLLAMELGAAEERIAEAEAARDTAEARNLPASARESVPVRVGRITAERDQARRQAEQLQQQLAARDRELRETRAELDRIKRTIRP
jgi:chromosome segregation ATPase